VYDESGARLERFTIETPLSEGLYPIIKSIDERFAIVKLLYARGPGSFTGLKLSYLFCKSFAFVREIPFLAASSFALNGDREVLAHGRRRFVKNGDTIAVEISDAPFKESLTPPKTLDLRVFDERTLPVYVLDAAYKETA
jgi:tRNA A37 threonylcarbamoyladenosine modification protein TsaB